MKKILPIAVANICALAISTSCDTAEVNPAAELVADLGTQTRGFDPTFINNNLSATANFPYSLLPGETITFSTGGSTRPSPLGTHTVVSSNTLREVRSGNPAITPGDESSFTYQWRPGNGRDPVGQTQSNLVNAEIFTSIQHDWGFLGLETPISLPTPYNELINSSRNATSIYNSYREWLCEQSLSDAQIFKLQQEALSSIGLFSFVDPQQTTPGPMVRVTRVLTLDDITSTNQTLRDTGVITGTYTFREIYYQVNTFATALFDESDGEAQECDIVFNPTVVHVNNVPVPFEHTQTGTFTIQLNGLLIP